MGSTGNRLLEFSIAVTVHRSLGQDGEMALSLPEQRQQCSQPAVPMEDQSSLTGLTSTSPGSKIQPKQDESYYRNLPIMASAS